MSLNVNEISFLFKNYGGFEILKVLILGMDGYLGFSTMLRMIAKGHQVFGIDNFSKRKNLRKHNLISAFHVKKMEKRIDECQKTYRNKPKFYECSTVDRDKLNTIIRKTKPDVIFNFAEIPSAPYSMKNLESCLKTWRDNTEGTLTLLWAMKEFSPKTHLIKLGTMGEYGQPDVPIAEGYFKYTTPDGKHSDILPFPKQAGSFYHQTKVADTYNIAMACKQWNLSCTDIMQGIIYGTRTPEIDKTRIRTMFYFDETFGTVINRFASSVVIDHPIPIYGNGTMTRAILSLSDAIDCYELIMNKRAQLGEHRVINQFDEWKKVIEMGEIVQKLAKKMGYNPKIKFYKNPRVEKEFHFYKPESKKLKKLGYKRGHLYEDVVTEIIEDLQSVESRIKKYKHVIPPTTQWR